jgi:hypothetical protein
MRLLKQARKTRMKAIPRRLPPRSILAATTEGAE